MTDAERIAFNLAGGLAAEVARMAAKPGHYVITVKSTVTETSPGKGQLTYVEYNWVQHDLPEQPEEK